MKNAAVNHEPHITVGSVFDDLGLDPGEALEAKIKAEIWRAIMEENTKRGFSQARLAEKLRVHQPDVSNLLNGKMSRFSVSKLIQFAARLNLQARVQVTKNTGRSQKVKSVTTKSKKAEKGQLTQI